MGRSNLVCEPKISFNWMAARWWMRVKEWERVILYSTASVRIIKIYVFYDYVNVTLFANVVLKRFFSLKPSPYSLALAFVYLLL
jgi:hypothetical protein